MRNVAALSFCALILFGIGAANSATIQVDLVGQVSSASNSTGFPNNFFKVGDAVTYTVKIDNDIFSANGGGTGRTLSAIESYSLNFGDYQVTGSSGDIFMRENAASGSIFGGDPYDQISVSHLRQDVYEQGFGGLQRTDFDTTSGSIGGVALRSFSFLVQTPSTDFIKPGDSVFDVFSAIESDPSLLQTPNAGISVSFLNGAFGSIPVSGRSTITSVTVTDLSEPEPEPALNKFVAELITGSPATLSQIVDVPATAFEITFDYLFETTTGFLQVFLGGVEIGQIGAPASLEAGFLQASFLVDGALLGQTGIALEFLLNGPTGSTLLVDNVAFPGIQNGDFETGNLNAWQTTGPGSVGVAQLTIGVPSPAAWAVLIPGLVGLGLVRRRNYRRSWR